MKNEHSSFDASAESLFSRNSTSNFQLLLLMADAYRSDKTFNLFSTILDSHSDLFQKIYPVPDVTRSAETQITTF